MPGRDGTGPMGLGAITGRGMGPCAETDKSSNVNPTQRNGLGLWLGYGLGIGRGNGIGRRSYGYGFFGRGRRNFR